MGWKKNDIDAARNSRNNAKSNGTYVPQTSPSNNSGGNDLASAIKRRQQSKNDGTYVPQTTETEHLKRGGTTQKRSFDVRDMRNNVRNTFQQMVNEANNSKKGKELVDYGAVYDNMFGTPSSDEEYGIKDSYLKYAAGDYQRKNTTTQTDHLGNMLRAIGGSIGYDAYAGGNPVAPARKNTAEYQQILDQIEQNKADRASLPARQKAAEENAKTAARWNSRSVEDIEAEYNDKKAKAKSNIEYTLANSGTSQYTAPGAYNGSVDLSGIAPGLKTFSENNVDGEVLYYDEDGTPVNYQTLIGRKYYERDMGNIRHDQRASKAYDAMEEAEYFSYLFNNAFYESTDSGVEKMKNTAGNLDYAGRLDAYLMERYGKSAQQMRDSGELNALVSRMSQQSKSNAAILDSLGYDSNNLKEYSIRELDKADYLTMTQNATEYAKAHPIKGTLLGIASAPAQGIEYVTNTIGSLKYEDNPYMSTNVYTMTNTGMTGAVNAGAGERVYDDVYRLTGYDTAAWLAQTAYSGVTSSIQSAVTMAVASAIFGPDAGGAVGMLMLGSQAAASTYQQAVLDGSTNGQAFLYSLASGLNEAIFEKLSFGELGRIEDIISAGMDSKVLSRAFLKAFALQGLTEGSEEVFTDLANSLADKIINGDLSEYNRSVQAYIQQGYSREEAKHLASMDYMQQLLESGLGGMFGGMVSGGGKAVSTVARYGARGATAVGDRISSVKQENNAFRTAGQNIVDNGNIDAIVNQANEITGNSRQANRARQAANKLASIDTSTEKGRSQAEKQAAKTSKAIIKYNNTTATKAAETSARSIIADELKKAGYSGRTFDSMVGAIYKRTFDGDARLSHSEKNALKSINDVKGIVNAVLQRYTDGEVDTAVKDARIKRVTDNQRVISAAISETTTDNDGNKVTHNGTVINEEGKDLLSDGTEVEVVGIANAEDVVDEYGDRTGVKIEYQLSDGTTVSQSEVSLGSVNKAVAYEGVAALGFSKETANRIIKAFDNSHMSGESFLSAMREAYLSGFTGTELSANGMASLLSDTVRNEIETAGKEDAVADYKSKADRAYNAQRAYRSNFGEDGTIKTGGVYKLSEGKEAVNMRKAIDEYTDEQQTQIKVLQKVAEGITHNNIFVFESEIKNGERVYAYDVTDENGKVLFKKGEHADNGFYLDNGDIYIDLNAGYDTGDTVGTMLWTAAHECGHFIKDWNGLAFRKLTKFFQEQIGEKKFNNLVDAKVELGNSRTAAIEEVVCDSLSQMFTDPNAREGMSVLMANEPNIAHKIAEFLNKFADALDKIYSSYPARSEEALLVQRWSEDVKKAYGNLFGESLVTAGDNYSAGLANIRQNGIEYDEKTGTLYAPRLSANYTFANTTDKNLIKKRKTLINNIAEVTGISRDQAEKFVRTEELAALMVKGTMLEFTGSDMETAIKKNSDYPQGTIDLTNICTKRVPLTKLINRLQEALPSDLMTADDYADIRLILMNDGRTVACGLCFVEDRRQKLGEIFEDFTGWYTKALEEGGHLQRKNSEGEIKDVRIAKDLAKRYGVQSGLIYPSLYEDVELDQEIIGSSDKWYEFQKNHPQVAAAFEAFNNARGQSAGRLLLERAEYKREILSWSDATVQKVNDAGGLRIFSFSDFEAIHLVDLLQIIEDCASKGVKIQGYTKQTAFAKLVSKTGIKLNRSFIPHGRTGITELPNGTKVLAIDTTGGMNPNDPDFINEKNNPNVGNNITGINDEQIHLAMQDNFFHYIIPFHTNKSGAANSKLGVQGWRNYKAYQTDRSIIGGMDTIRKLALLTKQYKKTMSDTDAYDRAFKELGVSKKALGEGDNSESGMVNIYTDVLTDNSVVNARTFVEKYLEVCAARGIEPRFSQFLDCDKDGNYKYVKGYEKFLVDFKLFDNKGNILPQGLVTPVFDQKFIKKIINDELNKTDMQKAAETYPEELFGDIYNYIRAKHGYKDADMESYQKYKAIVDKTAKASNEDAGAGGFEGNIQASPSARKDAVAKAAKELNVSDEGTLADNIRKSERIKDKNLLNFLNKQYEDGDVIHTFKTMQIIDGKLYSPMAAKVKDENGKYQWSEPNTIGVWQQAVEDPSNIIIDKKNGRGYYKLNKGNGKSIRAAYNPYEHSSNLVLNDQFESAYKRDNLVTVECIIPKSEMSSGYKAQYAKDSTGMLDWKSGCVAEQLEGNPRKVYLSRYLMPVRIVSDAEVAEMYKDILDGTGVAVPFNVITPGLLSALEDAGVPVDYEGSPAYKSRNKSDIRREARVVSNKILMGSLFSGGGTLESGLVYEMLENEFAVEYDAKIASVYSANHPGNMHVGDVQNFSAKGKKDIFYLHASPSCKQYSTANHSGGENDIDIKTAQATARALEETKPYVFTVENVERYLGSEAYKVITDKLDELGYQWDADVYNAADFGSPTKRKRLILRAVREGTLPAKPVGNAKHTSWADATRDLWNDEKYLKESFLNDSMLKAIRNTPRWKDVDLRHYKGAVLFADTTRGGMISYATEDQLAPTITTKCGEYRILIDGKIYRPTPEFMGRLQGLPENYKYTSDKSKSITRGFKVIGNGIPTQLTKGVMGNLIEEAYVSSHGGNTLSSGHNDAEPDIRRDSRQLAPKFYSQLERTIANMKMDKIGTSSVINFLKGKGVKDEEIKWSGLIPFLEGKKSVTKAELQQVLDESRIQIETVVKDNSLNRQLKDSPAEYESEWTDAERQEYAKLVADSDRDSKAFEDAWFKEFGEKYPSDSRYSMLAIEASSYLPESGASDELGVAMKNASVSNSKRAYFKGQTNRAHYDAAKEAAKANMTRWYNYQLSGGTAYREYLFKLPGNDYSNRAMEMHWEGNKGVIAHARVQDMFSAEGDMLFIDEIQSDWHNEGAKEGFGNDKAPDAPYAGTTDSYVPFVLKNLIREAAENDYDSIGWTTAKLQSDRWDEKFAEGYRIEYDQEIPKFLKKYGKQWGATVGKTTLDNGAEVWMMNITDAMKESVLYEGQPRFDKRHKNPLDRSFMSALKVAAQVAEQNAENKPQAEWLHKYQEAIDNVNETRQDLEAARAKVRELKEKASAERKANGDVSKETAEELIKAQNNVKTYTGRMNARNERMRKLGEAQPVKAVLGDAIKQYNDELEQRLEAKRERQVSRLEDQIAGYKERRVKAVDKHKSVEARQKIHKLLKDFNKRLTNPTENAYIPKSMKGVVADLLNQVEFATPGTNLSKELSAFKVTYDAIANNPEENVYHDKMISDMIAETIKSIGETQFNDLSAAQATQLLNTMKAIDHTIKDAIKVKGIETEQNAFQFAKQMMEETGSIEKPHANIFSRYINTSLRAQAMFNRLGNHIKDSNWSKLYDMLDAGQLKMTQILMEGERQLADIFADRESLYALSDYKHGLVDVGLRDENGNPVKITRGMALSVYMALLNEDNARHVMYGGYTIPDMKAYYKSSPDAYGTGETRTASQVTAIQEAEKKLADLKHQKQELIHKRVEIREGIKELKRAKDSVNQAKQEAVLKEITEKIEDYDTRINDATENLEEAVKFVDDYVQDMKLRIEGMMTDYEKHLIQKAKNLLDRWSKNKLNETTLEEYGFEKATVENYFPIHTDKDFLGASFDTISRDMALENAGFMKSRIKGTNPVMLEDITDVLNRQIKSVAQYSGLMPAIRQFNRIYGKNTANYENSVQNAIRMKFGPSGIKYIDNLMSDMVGARQTSSTIFDKARGKMAGAVLSVNPRVAMAQAASYPTAAAEIGWKPLLKALAKGGKSGRPISRADVKLIGTYSPLLDYRMKGYSTEEIGSAKAARRFSSKFADKSKWLMGWINAFDGGTVGRLWYAAEYYVQDNFDLEKGSEEYYEQVADVFNRIVEKTQPNYTTLQRPDVLRNPNAIVKQLTMFMTQRLQNFNILYDSCATLKQYSKDAKHGRNGTTLDDVKDARAAVVRAVTSQVVAAFVIVAMKGLSDVMLHSVNAYRDDDKELTAESVTGTLLNNILDTITSSFLGGSEAYGITKSIVMGDKYDAPQITGVQAFSDVLSDITNFAKAVRDGETEKIPKIIEGLAIELSHLTGIPMQNIKKILVGAKNWYLDFVNHELGTFEAGVNRTGTQNANLLYDAIIEGDSEAAEKYKRTFDSSSEYHAAIRKELYENDPRIAQAGQAFYNGDLKTPQHIIDEMVREGIFEQSDIVNAIKAAANKLRPEDEGLEDWYNYEEELKDATLFSGTIFKDNIFDAMAAGNTAFVNDAKKLVDNPDSYLMSILGDSYKGGKITSKDVETYAARYTSKTKNEVYWEVEKWNYIIKTGSDDGYKKYLRLCESIGTSSFGSTLRDYQTHGCGNDDIKDGIRGFYKEAYLKGSTAEKNRLLDRMKNAMKSIGYTIQTTTKNGKTVMATTDDGYPKWTKVK